MLGRPPSGKVQWDIAIGRGMGAMLFLYSLRPLDPLRLQLEQKDAEAAAVKAALAALANDKERLPDEEVQQLCEMIAAQEKGEKADNSDKVEENHLCWNTQLGGLAEHFLSSKSKVMARHLSERQKAFKSMRVFIYGHTHQFENPWSVDLEDTGLTISVANTGAFQRLIDEAAFLNRLNGRSPQEPARGIRARRATTDSRDRARRHTARRAAAWS